MEWTDEFLCLANFLLNRGFCRLATPVTRHSSKAFGGNKKKKTVPAERSALGFAHRAWPGA